VKNRLIQKAGALMLAPMFALLTACGGANNPAFENADMEVMASKPVDFMPSANVAAASDSAAAADAAIAADAAAQGQDAVTAVASGNAAVPDPGAGALPAAVAGNAGEMDAARAAANAAAMQGDMGTPAPSDAAPAPQPLQLAVAGDGSIPTVVTEVAPAVPSPMPATAQ
jgi:hypothetical protein